MAVFYVLKLLPYKEGINIQTAFWVKFFSIQFANIQLKSNLQTSYLHY